MEKLIDKFLPADYHDTFVIKASKPAEQIVPKELIEKIFNHSPAWPCPLQSQKYPGEAFWYRRRRHPDIGRLYNRRYRERSHHEEGRQASVVLCFHCQDRQ